MKLLNIKTITSLLLLLFLATGIAQATGVSPAVAAGGLAALGFLRYFLGQKTEAGAALAVEVEIWENMIAENLYEDHPWMLRSKNRNDRIITGPGGVQVVHIPQAGEKVNVVKNREQYPIPVVIRNDSDITYSLDKFSTDGMLLTEAEKYQLSYDKAMSLLRDAGFSTQDTLALELAHRWATTKAANIVRSTGASAATYLPGTTGNRKKFLPDDLASAKTIINKQTKKKNRSTQGLWALMGYDAYNQLKSNADIRDRDKMDALGAVWEGSELRRLHGFELYVDDQRPRYTAAAELKSLTAADAATDNDAILCFDEEFIHRAVGTVKFYEDTDNALYQGDLYSAFVMAGGRQERKDEEGCAAVVQVAP